MVLSSLELLWLQLGAQLMALLVSICFLASLLFNPSITMCSSRKKLPFPCTWPLNLDGRMWFSSSCSSTI